MTLRVLSGSAADLGSLGVPVVVGVIRNGRVTTLPLPHVVTDGAAANVDVVGPCNLAWETSQAAIEKYFDTISDHCPLVADITLQ